MNKAYIYIEKFLQGLSDYRHRFVSFDYCYTYFMQHQGNAASIENISMSCYILWSYLASWGMLRGSSQLLQKNPKFLEGTIAAIDKKSFLYGNQFDYQNYNNPLIRNQIIDGYDAIKESLSEINPSPTLVTKIMLGVYGCVPALDRNFRIAFSLGQNDLNENTLIKIYLFKDLNTGSFNCVTYNNPNAYDYQTSKFSKFRYSNAKMVDMYGFMKGMVIDYLNKHQKLTEYDVLGIMSEGKINVSLIKDKK